MLKVEKVEYGMAPVGADSGMPCFAIRLIDDNEGDLGIGDLDPVKDVEKIGEIFFQKATEIANDIDAKIKDIGQEDRWLECLSQPKPNDYIYFIGRVITDDEYFYVINMVLQVISSRAKDLQQLIHESGKKIELCAPKFAMIVLGNSPYIKKDIVQACNFVVCHLPTELDGERLEFMNKSKFYHINGLTNVGKHPFGSFIFVVNSEDDLRLFTEFYEPAMTYKTRGAVRIVPGNEGVKKIAQEFAFKNRFRYNEVITGDNVVSFDL